MSGQTSGLTDAEVKTQAAQLVIKKNYDKIVSTITVEDVVPTLFSNDVIGVPEKQEIQAGKTQLEKSQALADCLLRKSGKQFEQFCSILEETRMFTELVHAMNSQYGEAVATRLEEENRKHSATQLSPLQLQVVPVPMESHESLLTPPPDSPNRPLHFPSAPASLHSNTGLGGKTTVGQQDGCEPSQGKVTQHLPASPLTQSPTGQLQKEYDDAFKVRQAQSAPVPLHARSSSPTAKRGNCGNATKLPANNEELLKACIDGREDDIESFIKSSPSELNVACVDEAGLTPLHYAVKNKLKRGLPAMVQHSTFTLGITDRNGQTPLHYAALEGDRKLLQLLHRSYHVTPSGEVSDRDPLPGDIQDKDGNTSLHLAVKRGDIHVVRALIQDFKCSTDVKNKEGKTPVYLAVDKGNIPLVTLLMGDCSLQEDSDTTSQSSMASEGKQEEGTAMISKEDGNCGNGTMCTEQSGGSLSELVGTDTTRKTTVYSGSPRTKGMKTNVIAVDITCQSQMNGVVHGSTIYLPPMPVELQVISSTLLNGKIYIIGIATDKQAGSYQVQVYSIKEGRWSMLPEAPNHNAPISVIDGRITLIGGRKAVTDKPTNILSTWFEEEGQWKHIIPPMPSGRVASGIFQHENLLLVTGGIVDHAKGAENDYRVVNTVDVFDFITKQWNRIAELQLPLAVRSHKLVASGDYIYLVAGATMIPARVEDGDQHFNSRAWRARWSDIKAAAEKGVAVQPSLPERSVWTPIANPPVLRSTVVSHDNTILLVGGLKDGLPQNSIYSFVTEKAINRWIKVGSMDMGRYRHAVVALPAFFIAGGYVKSKPEEDEANVKTQDVDIVLFAPVEQL